jgi:hypothetical protein
LSIRLIALDVSGNLTILKEKFEKMVEGLLHKRKGYGQLLLPDEERDDAGRSNKRKF